MSTTTSTTLPKSLTDAGDDKAIEAAWQTIVNGALGKDAANYMLTFFHKGKVEQGFREVKRTAGTGPKWYTVSAWGEKTTATGGYLATANGDAALSGKTVSSKQGTVTSADAAKALPKLAAYGKDRPVAVPAKKAAPAKAAAKKTAPATPARKTA